MTDAQKAATERDRCKKRLIVEQAKDVPCADCGIKYPPCVMNFVHRDKNSKKFTIAMGHVCVGIEKLKKEIAKCDVVCANCHCLRMEGK